MFTPELQRSIRTSSQNTPGGRCLTPLSSSTPRRKSVGHIPLSASWGSSPNTRAAVQEVNNLRSGSFSLPRRASLTNNLEKSVLSRSRSTLRINSNDEDSVFMNKEVTFQDSMRGDSLRVESLRSDSLRGDSLRVDSLRSDSLRGDSLRGDSLRIDSLRGSVQSLNKYDTSQMFIFDDTAQTTQQQNSLVHSNSIVEFEQALFERTALRHARRLRLQEEATELCQETALMLEKTAKLMANTARVRRLRIKLDMDLLDVDGRCFGRQMSRDLDSVSSEIQDDTLASEERIYHEIDALKPPQHPRKKYDDEKENRMCSPHGKRPPFNSPVQTNRAAKLRSNSIRKQRDGSGGTLIEKPPAIPRRKTDKKGKVDIIKDLTTNPLNHSRLSLKEKHAEQEQPDKDQADKATTEKPVKQGFQMKLKKVSKKLTSSRLSLDKKVDINMESTWL